MIRDPVDFQMAVERRRRNRMDQIDALSPELRELVHDYSWSVVKACLDCGVKEPRHIRHIVELVLDEFSPTRGSYSAQGIRTHIIESTLETKEGRG